MNIHLILKAQFRLGKAAAIHGFMLIYMYTVSSIKHPTRHLNLQSRWEIMALINNMKQELCWKWEVTRSTASFSFSYLKAHYKD